MKTEIATLVLLSAVSASVPARAGTELSGGTDRSPASYAAGDAVRFSFSAREDGGPVDAEVSWTVKFDDGSEPLRGTGLAKAGAPLVVEARAPRPGFLVATGVAAGPGSAPGGGDGARTKRNPLAVSVGAGAGVGESPAMDEPGGFDASWEEVRAEAAAADLSAAKRVPLGEVVADAAAAPDAGPGSFAFELPLGGGLAATGFVVEPKVRTGRKLPLVVAFAGYDEIDPNPSPRHPLWGLPGAIVAHVSAYGFPPGRDRAFYAEAFDAISAGGNGGAFAFRDEENVDPRSCPLRAVAVRDLAAMRFLETLEGLDGSGATVVGAHFGAWRATVAAAAAPAVSGAALWNPWLCDLGGAEKFGRPRGWLPSWTPALGFFDAVFLARRVFAPCAVVEAQLVSASNPPAGTALFHAALGGPKSVSWKNPGAGRVRARESRRIPAGEVREALAAVAALSGK